MMVTRPSLTKDVHVAVTKEKLSYVAQDFDVEITTVMVESNPLLTAKAI
jgi:hypothetical protein